MRGFIGLAVVAVALVPAVAAEEKIELLYKADIGIQATIEAEGTSEGSLWGTMPDAQRFTFTGKEKRKMVGRFAAEPVGDTADWRVTGERTVEMAFGGNPQDPRTETIGPVVFTFDTRGQLQGTKVEPFEASAENLMRFRWWSYIVQQLDLPPVLPAGPVARGESWESTVNLSGPDGKPLRAKAVFRLLGVSTEAAGKTAWIRGDLVLPLKFRFKTDEGQYNVDGKVRMDRVIAFDMDAGLPRGSTDRAAVDMSIHARSAAGEEFRSQLVMHVQGKTTFKPKKPAE